MANSYPLYIRISVYQYLYLYKYLYSNDAGSGDESLPSSVKFSAGYSIL